MPRFAHALAAAFVFSCVTLTGCAKHTDDASTISTTTTTSTTTTESAATASPDATASTDPNATAAAAATTAATDAATTTTTTTSSGASPSPAFVTLPVYPGAATVKAQSYSANSSDGSVEMNGYTTKDDAQSVIDFYKKNLPASWQNASMTTDGKTTGTFAWSGAAGGQSVTIATADGGGTTILAMTKHQQH